MKTSKNITRFTVRLIERIIFQQQNRFQNSNINGHSETV